MRSSSLSSIGNNNNHDQQVFYISMTILLFHILLIQIQIVMGVVVEQHDDRSSFREQQQETVRRQEERQLLMGTESKKLHENMNKVSLLSMESNDERKNYERPNKINSGNIRNKKYSSSAFANTLPFNNNNVMKVKENELLLIDEMKKNNNESKYHGEVAVVHIGPHKTGTTTMQHTMKNYIETLYDDGYHIPGNWSNYSWVNMMILTDCLRKDKKDYVFTYNDIDDDKVRRKQRQLRSLSTTTTKRVMETNSHESDHTNQEDSLSHRKLGNFPCDMNILEEIKYIASQPNSNNNLLLTAESFSGKFMNMDRVQYLLRPWNKVVIIAYYRRFYEWFHSQWNQMYKDSNPDVRPHFIDFITLNNGSNIDYFAYNNYILGLIPRWEETFVNTTILTTTGQQQHGEIKLYNLHNLPEKTISESFFCQSIPNATKTCNAVRMRIKNIGELKDNPSIPFIYSDLAYLAQQQSNTFLISEQAKSYPIEYLTRLVRNYQESTLGLTQYDFDNIYRTCPPQTILDKLLYYTYETERKYFPDFFYSDKGKGVIYEHFQKDARTKLCTINATVFLQNNQTWQDFFQSL